MSEPVTTTFSASAGAGATGAVEVCATIAVFGTGAVAVVGVTVFFVALVVLTCLRGVCVAAVVL
ncbi:hypothetical protein [Gluconacetobacter asukensis]|uniref:hypothetical protein n=1 Tax=Gluconacetobacter asukensis TaxID=1017181 RepID=UPI001FE55942